MYHINNTHINNKTDYTHIVSTVKLSKIYLNKPIYANVYTALASILIMLGTLMCIYWSFPDREEVDLSDIPIWGTIIVGCCIWFTITACIYIFTINENITYTNLPPLYIRVLYYTYNAILIGTIIALITLIILLTRHTKPRPQYTVITICIIGIGVLSLYIIQIILVVFICAVRKKITSV